jgi:hypothetical protein
MHGDQRVQPRHAVQALRKLRPSQPPAGLVNELDVVMVLGPVIPDEQHPPSLNRPRHDQQR